MDLDELGKRLHRIAGVEAGPLFESFHTETGSSDLDEFLAYLRERGAISGGAFCALHASAPIRITPMPAAPVAPLVSPAHPIVSQSRGVARATPDAMTVIPVGAAALAASPAAAAAPSQYRILGAIGRGAMGEVSVARDSELGRTVALKRIVPELAGDAAIASRFFLEAEITAQLDHPNVVPVYDFEIAGTQLGYTMKLVEGRSLTKVIEDARAQLAARGARDEPARLAERLRYFLAVCDAVAYAHSKGVLHRDLKPDNVMIGRYGQVYVMDWGICHMIGTPDEDGGAAAERIPARAVHGQTRYGAIIGTPAYMSPEQAAGKAPELDARSDLYALGMILYELIALRRGLASDTIEQTLASATRAEKAPLGRRVGAAPIARDLAAVVDKATALSPDARYRDVTALADDVRAFLRGDPVSARRHGPIDALLRWVGRHKGATVIALLVVLLVGAGDTIGQLIVSHRVLDAAHRRAERIEAFQLAVARQSHALDTEFYGYEERVQHLAGHVAQVLDDVAPASSRVYFNADFEAPGAGPDDLALSRRYGVPASLSFPVFKLAPGVDNVTVIDDLGRLAGLRAQFEELLLGTSPTSHTQGTPRERILDRGVPALRTFVTLASGVHVSFPGTGGYPPEYDGRTRPKYTLVAGAPPGDTQVRWGNPFLDRYGHGLILPASVPVRRGDGSFAGATGLEMTFDSISELLPMRNATYVEATYLVDDHGDVVLGSGAGAAAAPRPDASATDADGKVTLAPIPYPEVLAAIESGHRGHLEAHGKVIVIAPISALGWWYVVVADDGQMGQ